jgi:hypothetical protein
MFSLLSCFVFEPLSRKQMLTRDPATGYQIQDASNRRHRFQWRVHGTGFGSITVPNLVLAISINAPYIYPPPLHHRVSGLGPRHKIALALEGLKDISLFIQNEPICLLADLRQASPALEISRVMFITMCFLRMSPVALAET